MKLQQYIAVSALAFFAISCSKEQIAPNFSTHPEGASMVYSEDVSVFDESHQHSIVYKVRSNDANVLSTVSEELSSSTLQLQFDADGAFGAPDISSANSNDVFVTEIESNIGNATGYSIQKGN
jgi:hypothetical protein